MPALRPVPDVAPDAIGYIRRSIKGEETITYEVQEISIRDHCARHGYNLIGIVVDPGISGLAWEKRKGVQEVLTRVENGEASKVIIWRWSRLSRKTLHQAIALDRFEKAGAEVESATEPFDTTTAGGEFGRDVMLAAAAFDSKQKGEQWKDAHRRRLNNGLPHCGGNRLGYIYEDKAYAIDPEEADTVRWLYREYLDGRGFTSLRDGLNRLGIKNSRGKEWDTSTLTRVMDSGFAAGLVGTGVRSKNVTYRPGAHEAIIDQETWELYLAARRTRTKTPNEVSPKYRLSGLVTCGDCGARMVSASGSGSTGDTYLCGRWRNTGKVRCVTVKRSRVEKAVIAWLESVAHDAEQAAEADRGADRVQARAKADVQIVAREISELDKQLKQLTRQLSAGIVPESAYIETRDEILHEKTQLQARLDTARLRDGRKAQDAGAVAARLVRDWDILPVSECRHLVASLTQDVVVVPNARPYARAKVLVMGLWERQA